MPRPTAAPRARQRRSTSARAFRCVLAAAALLPVLLLSMPVRAATDPLRLAARAPADLDALVIVRSGADLMDLARRSPAGRDLAARLLTEQTQRSWRALSARLGWSERETADRLFGGLCLLGVYDAGEREPGWAFVAEVSAETSARLRANLDAFPRQVIAGHPVLSIEDGAYVLVLRPPGRGADPQRSHRLLIAPTAGGGERRLSSLVGMLSGEGPAPFARTPAFRRLREADPALFAIIMKEPAQPADAQAQPPRGDWSAFTLIGLSQGTADGGNPRLAIEFARTSPDLAQTLRSLPALPDAIAEAIPSEAVVAVFESSSTPAEAGNIFSSTRLLGLLPVPWDAAAEGARDRPLARVMMLRDAEHVPPAPSGTRPQSPPATPETPRRYRIDLAELHARIPGHADARHPDAADPPAPQSDPVLPDPMDARIAAMVGRDLGLLSRIDPGVTRSLEVRAEEGDLFALTGSPAHVLWRAEPIAARAKTPESPAEAPPEPGRAPDQVNRPTPPTSMADPHAWWWSCSILPHQPQRDPKAPSRSRRAAQERLALASIPLGTEPARRWIAHGWVRPAQAPEQFAQRLAAVPALAVLMAEAERYAWSVWAEADGRLEARISVDLRHAQGAAPPPATR